MAAYVKLEISGNKDFGGYLEIDEGKSIRIEDGDVLEISEGQHIFQVSTTSKLERGFGSFQSKLSSMTSSSGAILDSLEEHQINKNLGDSWTFQVIVAEGQAVLLSVLTKKEKIISAPMYSVVDLDAETLTKLEEHFNNIRIEQERIANTPRRSGKMIGIGLAIMIFFGSMLAMTFTSNGASFPSEAKIAWGAIVAIGLLVFILGMRKKVRK